MDGLGIQVENSTRPPTSSKVGAHGGGNSVAERPGGGTPRPSGAAEPTDTFGDDGLTAASVPEGCALWTFQQWVIQGALPLKFTLFDSSGDAGAVELRS